MSSTQRSECAHRLTTFPDKSSYCDLCELIDNGPRITGESAAEKWATALWACHVLPYDPAELPAAEALMSWPDQHSLPDRQARRILKRLRELEERVAALTGVAQDDAIAECDRTIPAPPDLP